MSGKQRNIRQKRADSDDDLDPGTSSHSSIPGPEETNPLSLKERLEETRLIQKQRKKLGGTCAERLAKAGTGAQAVVETIQTEDPEAASMARLMNSYVKATSVQESDEDPQMKKFVEMELAKRLGKREADEQLDEGEQRRRKIDEDLYSIPDHLQSIQQDVPLAGMMTGISEVTLPLEQRLKRIEETEKAKRNMLAVASKRAHIPMEVEQTTMAPTKMKRNVVPLTFGKADEVKKVDRDREELEKQRRRVITETRPWKK